MATALLIAFSSLAFVGAQQQYILTSGPTPRPQCSARPACAQPTYYFGSFGYSMSETVRTATSVPPATTTITYAPPPEALACLIPNISYTTWGSWDPNATTTASDTDNPYDSAAWTA